MIVPPTFKCHDEVIFADHVNVFLLTIIFCQSMSLLFFHDMFCWSDYKVLFSLQNLLSLFTSLQYIELSNFL